VLSVIIPASDEERLIGGCLAALAAQAPDAALDRDGVEIIVAANGCRDGTVAAARDWTERFAARGWPLRVLDLAQGGKLAALNAAEAVAAGDMRAYLDADVRCGRTLLPQIRDALDVAAARYATGRIEIAPAQSLVTRRYADVWTTLPFIRSGAVGAGFFAVNAAGRARWESFPDIVSDDTFVRLQFTPEERIEVEAGFTWPLVEGFANLVRVRRRQDRGVREIRRRWPQLLANERKPPPDPAALLRLAIENPLGVSIYAAVRAAVLLADAVAPSGRSWSRGR
jgi:glycosyltransferase involved in cell wall biosynthesis